MGARGSIGGEGAGGQDKRMGRDGPTEGNTRGPPGPKNIILIQASCTSKLNRRVSPERWGVQAMTKCKQFTSRFFHSESFSQTASSQP